MWSWLSKLDPNSLFVVGSAAAMFVYHRVRPAATIRYLSLDDARRLALSVYRIELQALLSIGRRLSDFPEAAATARAGIGELAQAAAIEAVKQRAALAKQTISEAWLADIQNHLRLQSAAK